MLHAEQIKLGHRLLGYIDANTSTAAASLYQNPVSDYTCPQQAAQEHSKLFRQRPLCLAASAQLPGPNTFLAHDLLDVPILMTRDGTGAVRAFLNVCRHRGARVAEGCGAANRFICPYHAWTYRADGRLAARPEDAAFDGMDKAAHGLTELPCAELHGLIFVQPTPGSEPIDINVTLQGLASEVGNYDLAGYTHFKTYDSEWNLNWKLGIDTFLESYHFGTLHKQSIHPILHGNVGAFDAFGENLRLLFARRSIAALKDAPEAEWDLPKHLASVYILFPNTVLVRQGEHVELWHAFPRGVDAVQFRVTILIPEPPANEAAEAHWDKNLALLLKTVEEEDFPVGEGIQQSFRSGAQEHITFGRNEPALHHFHRTVRKALDMPLAAGDQHR
jgi:phenylpropionate dioxygenase-like ring-hydroxylating dioxygenase large terminal subunit